MNELLLIVFCNHLQSSMMNDDIVSLSEYDEDVVVKEKVKKRRIVDSDGDEGEEKSKPLRAKVNNNMYY